MAPAAYVHPQAHSGAGETYELSISKSLVYGSVGAVLVLLAVVLVVLTVFFSPSQRKLHRQKYNVSCEWQREIIPGSFQNTGIWEGTSCLGQVWGQSWRVEKGREGTVGRTGVAWVTCVLPTYPTSAATASSSAAS